MFLINWFVSVLTIVVNSFRSFRKELRKGISASFFEQMEPRLLCSASVLMGVQNGELRIEGSDRVDKVSVLVYELQDGGLEAVVKVDRTTSVFGGFERVILNGNGGNDRIKLTMVASSQSCYAYVHGGSGNDRLEVDVSAENGGVSIYGDDGNDRIIGKSNVYMSLRGDDGNDNIRVLEAVPSRSDLSHYASGGSGNDRIYSEAVGYLAGDEGNDVITLHLGEFSARTATLISQLDGGTGRNIMKSVSYPFEPTVYFHARGNDRIYGGGTYDFLTVEEGAERVYFNGGAGYNGLGGVFSATARITLRNVDYDVRVANAGGKG